MPDVPEDVGVEAVDPTAIEGLRDQLGGQDEVLDRVIEIYLNELAPRLAAIRDALDRKDPEAMRDAAHALRGSSATLGAVELAEICEQLEVGARAGVLDTAPGLMDRLDDAAGRTERTFRNHLRR